MDWFDIIKQTRLKNIEGLIRELYKVTADPNAHQNIKGQLTEDKLNAAIAAAKQKTNQVPLPKQSPPPPPPKKKLPSQTPPQLSASATKRSAFQNVLNQPKKIVTTEKDLTEGARLAAQRQTQPQQVPLPQQTQQPQQPATAPQKKTLSGRVKAALQRRKMGKNQKIVDRQRKEMVRMMTPEQRRQYQLEEA